MLIKFKGHVSMSWGFQLSPVSVLVFISILPFASSSVREVNVDIVISKLSKVPNKLTCACSYRESLIQSLLKPPLLGPEKVQCCARREDRVQNTTCHFAFVQRASPAPEELPLRSNQLELRSV